jgi:hypothetical protein
VFYTVVLVEHIHTRPHPRKEDNAIVSVTLLCAILVTMISMGTRFRPLFSFSVWAPHLLHRPAGGRRFFLRDPVARVLVLFPHLARPLLVESNSGEVPGAITEEHCGPAAAGTYNACKKNTQLEDQAACCANNIEKRPSARSEPQHSTRHELPKTSETDK